MLAGQCPDIRICRVLCEERHRIFSDMRFVDAPHHNATGLNPFPGMAQHREFDTLVAFSSTIMVIRRIDPAHRKGIVGRTQAHGIATNRLLRTKSCDTLISTRLIQFVRIRCQVPVFCGNLKKYTIPCERVDHLVTGMSGLNE